MRVSEKDRLDFNYVIVGLNNIFDYIRQPLPIDMSEDYVNAYYDALMEQYKEFKIKEYILRLRFVEKYSIPYDFKYEDGEILE